MVHLLAALEAPQGLLLLQYIPIFNVLVLNLKGIDNISKLAISISEIKAQAKTLSRTMSMFTFYLGEICY